MKSPFRNSRKEHIEKKSLMDYLLYGIGEIALIIIGILIAVNINERIKQSQLKDLRCTYLNELMFTFEYDIKDVDGNISGFNDWTPKIEEVFNALRGGTLETLDSLEYKLGTVGNFIFFGQRSKSKIDELKFSDVQLISNRELKNRILLYQDSYISYVRNMENRYELLGEDLRKYYSENFIGFNYGTAKPLNLEKLKDDNLYASLVEQRLRMNQNFINFYQQLNKEQKNIHKLMKTEMDQNCP